MPKLIDTDKNNEITVKQLKEFLSQLADTDVITAEHLEQEDFEVNLQQIFMKNGKVVILVG